MLSCCSRATAVSGLSFRWFSFASVKLFRGELTTDKNVGSLALVISFFFFLSLLFSIIHFVFPSLEL